MDNAAINQNRRQTVRVTFSNGETLETEINGTIDEIVSYYIGKSFNLGKCDVDDLAVGESIRFSDNAGAWLQHHRTHKLIYKGAFGYVVDHGHKVGLEVHSNEHNGSKYFTDDRRLQLLAFGNHGVKWKRFINKEF